MKTKSATSKLKKMLTSIDKKVKDKNGLIMKREGIVFEQDGIFKYGIDSTDTRVTLHLIPMYANPQIGVKYYDGDLSG